MQSLLAKMGDCFSGGGAVQDNPEGHSTFRVRLGGRVCLYGVWVPGGFWSSPGSLPDAAVPNTRSKLMLINTALHQPFSLSFLSPSHNTRYQLNLYNRSSILHSFTHSGYTFPVFQKTNHPPKHHQNAVQLRRCCFRCPRSHCCCPELYYQQRVCLNLFPLCDANFLALTSPTVPPTVPFLAPLLPTLLRPVRLSRTPSLAVCWVLSSLLVLPW